MLCCTLFFSFPTSVMAKKKHNKQVCSKFLKAIWKKVVWCSILCHICIDQFISKQVLSLLRVYDFSWLEMYLSIGISISCFQPAGWHGIDKRTILFSNWMIYTDKIGTFKNSKIFLACFNKGYYQIWDVLWFLNSAFIKY